MRRTIQEVMTDMGALLLTALDFEPVPRSVAYLAMGSDIGRLEQVETIMVDAGLVTTTSTALTLTELGRAKALEIRERMKQ